MSLHIIEKPLGDYEKAKKSNSKRAWRRYARKAAVFSRKLTSTERKYVVEQVRLELLHETSTPWNLAFFAHPSVQVFESFLDNGSLIELFGTSMYRLHSNNPRNAHNHHKYVLEYAMLVIDHGFESFEDTIDVLGTVNTEITFVSNDTLKIHYEEALKEHISRNSLGSVVQEHFPFFRLAAWTGMIDTTLIEELRNCVWDYLELTVLGHLPPEGFWACCEDLSPSMNDILESGAWPKFADTKDLSSSGETIDSVQYMVSVIESKNIASNFKNTSWVNYSKACESDGGRLSVGIKIHPTTEDDRLLSKFYNTGGFALDTANGCVVLPPVGNAEKIGWLVEDFEKRSGLSILGSSDFQIQTCSPGLLSAENAAILGIVAYTGAEETCRYAQENFVSTQDSLTCGRFVVYGAGVMYGGFDWWTRDKNNKLAVTNIDNVLVNRTDIMACRTVSDIKVVNLAATLLIHAQYGGYFCDLGKQFINAVYEWADESELSDIFDVPWVYRENKHWGGSIPNQDEFAEPDPHGLRFFEKFSKLMDRSMDDARRIQQYKSMGIEPNVQSSMLLGMEEILTRFDDELRFQSFEATNS